MHGRSVFDPIAKTNKVNKENVNVLDICDEYTTILNGQFNKNKFNCGVTFKQKHFFANVFDFAVVISIRRAKFAREYN